MVRRAIMQCADDGYSIQVGSRFEIIHSTMENQDIIDDDGWNRVLPACQHMYAKWCHTLLIGHANTHQTEAEECKRTLEMLKTGTFTIPGTTIKFQPFPNFNMFFTIRRPKHLHLEKPEAQAAIRNKDTYRPGFQAENPYYHLLSPMITTEQRCFKRIPGNNDGFGQFMFMGSQRACIAMALLTMDHSEPVSTTDGVTIETHDTKVGTNIFMGGIQNSFDPLQGTPEYPECHCLICGVATDHNCDECHKGFCSWHGTDDNRLCGKCAEKHPERNCSTHDFDENDPFSVVLEAQSHELSLRTVSQMPPDLSLNPADFRPAEVNETIAGNVCGMVSSEAPGRLAYLRNSQLIVLRGAAANDLTDLVICTPVCGTVRKIILKREHVCLETNRAIRDFKDDL